MSDKNPTAGHQLRQDAAERNRDYSEQTTTASTSLTSLPVGRETPLQVADASPVSRAHAYRQAGMHSSSNRRTLNSKANKTRGEYGDSNEDEDQDEDDYEDEPESSSSSKLRLTKKKTTIGAHSEARTVDSSDYQLQLFKNLFKFKNENLFTDIYIYVDGVEFPCHKVVLCAASSYFKAMFSCDLKESRLGKVFIDNISPWTMKRLLDFIYTGKIEINQDNVIDLFNAAVMFQLYELADKCTDYINEHIDITNCIDIHIFASMYNLSKLESDAFNFILDNFMQLINQTSTHPHSTATTTASSANSNQAATADSLSYPDLVRLSEQTFSSLLRSDLLNVSREIYVYYGLKKWFDHYAHNSPTVACQSGMSIYESLFKYIRLNGLSIDELEYILANDKYVNANDHLALQIKRVLENKTNESQLGCKSGSPTSAVQRIYSSTQQMQLFPIGGIQSSKQLNKSSSLKTPSTSRQSSSSSASPPRCSTSSLSTTLATTRSAQTNQLAKSNVRSNNNSLSTSVRPSTLPREYLCLLEADRFQFYDFYKSKWDVLNTWPPLSSSSVEQNKDATMPSSKCLRLNGYSTCIVNNNLYIIGGHLIPDELMSYFSKKINQDEPIRIESNITNSIKNIELVDTVYRYNPIKNEWIVCKPMLRKRAFHLSINLKAASPSSLSYSSLNSSNYIFLFYGLCYSTHNSMDVVQESNQQHASLSPSLSINMSTKQSLVQCMSIDVYNLETDSWSVLNLNNSLLNIHVFQSNSNFNRMFASALIGDEAASSSNSSPSSSFSSSTFAAASNSASSNLSHLRHDDETHEQDQHQAIQTDINLIVLLNKFANYQLAQARSIVSLKNLIYILKENCIHCYEFNSKSNQLVCLPYFRLPDNLNTFMLASAISVKTTNNIASSFSTNSASCSSANANSSLTGGGSCVSLFSWFSDNEDSAPCSFNAYNPTNSLINDSLLGKPSNSTESDSLNITNDFANHLNNEEGDEENDTEKINMLNKNKKEAVIYLLSPQQSIIYEFYPAKNKLKKLPNLILKHSPNDTFIISIKSKIYVTGGINPANSNVKHGKGKPLNDDGDESMAIEVFDQEKNSWSIFMNKLEHTSASSAVGVFSLLNFNKLILNNEHQIEQQYLQHHRHNQHNHHHHHYHHHHHHHHHQQQQQQQHSTSEPNSPNENNINRHLIKLMPITKNFFKLKMSLA
jgi:hypothetical protein